MKNTTARAPAKLILSGEHSVVYGMPALVMAVNRATETTLTWREDQSISFDLQNFGYTTTETLQNLHALKQRANTKYMKFLHGETTICEVLPHPFELLQYAFIQLIDTLKINLPQGIAIQTRSNIPIGCGMGSSAAAIISFIHALNNFLPINLKLETYLQLGREIENFQHGHSSGVDLHIATYGGCAKFINGAYTTLPLPKIPLTLVNTGQPITTTGQCVNTVATKLKNNQELLRDFAAVTKASASALQNGNHKQLQECIRTNHRLLKNIGVVPNKVSNFIRDIEQLGGAAKVCGAGASQGDNAGVILVICDLDITNLINFYRYSMFNVEGDNSGTTIV